MRPKELMAKTNIAIIAVNIVYFIFLEIAGSSEDIDTMVKYGASYLPYIIENKEYWRLLTAIFMHFGIDHIANNMIVLYLLGDNLERALGRTKYLIFYLICGVGANIASNSVELITGNYYVGAGASGAIFGVIGGLLWAVIANKGRLEDLSTERLGFMLALMLYFGFTSTGVDNTAHVAGAVIGFLLSMIMYRKRRRRTTSSYTPL